MELLFLVESVDSWVLPFVPRRVDSAIARLEEAKNLARKVPPPDSDPFSDGEFGKNLSCSSSTVGRKRESLFNVFNVSFPSGAATCAGDHR